MGAGWQVEPGWYTDPSGLHEWRWWTGSQWAETISDGGVTANDELDGAAAVAQFPAGSLPPSTPVGARAWADAGWLPDPGGLHEYRWWDGKGWTPTIVDGGVVTNDELDDPDTAAQFPPGPPSPNATVAPPETLPVRRASFAEVGRFVLYLFGFLVVVTLCDSVDLAWALLLNVVAVIVVAPHVGYRRVDAFMLLIPVWSLFIVAKLTWRLACLPRRYWAPAPSI